MIKRRRHPYEERIRIPAKREAMEAALTRTVPLEDVLLVLRCWHNEKRLIVFHVGDDSVGGDAVIFAFGSGVIEELTPDFLRIESRSANSLETSGCTISLQRADRFALWDWQNAPEELTNKHLQEHYDANLTMAFGRTMCVLRTLRAAGVEGTQRTS